MRLALAVLFVLTSCYGPTLSSRERGTLYRAGRTGNFGPLIAERSSAAGAALVGGLLNPPPSYDDSEAIDQRKKQAERSQELLKQQGEEIDKLKSRLTE